MLISGLKGLTNYSTVEQNKGGLMTSALCFLLRLLCFLLQIVDSF